MGPLESVPALVPDYEGYAMLKLVNGQPPYPRPIPVTERLPEDSNVGCLLYCDGDWEIGWYGRVGWQIYHGDLILAAQPTHWMILPPAPEVQG